MTGSELQAIRHSLEMDAINFGRALGYSGSNSSVETVVRRFEGPGGRVIPPWIARLAYMYGRYGVPKKVFGKM